MDNEISQRNKLNSNLQPPIQSPKTESDTEENWCGQVCKGIAGIFIFIMVIVGIFIGAQLERFSYFLGITIAGVFTGMILWGIGEIIGLLHELLRRIQNKQS